MNQQPMLNEQEWGLLLDLLRSERRELPSEIRRTDTIHVHDDLQVRLKTIDNLIDRLQKSVNVQ